MEVEVKGGSLSMMPAKIVVRYILTIHSSKITNNNRQRGGKQLSVANNDVAIESRTI